MKNVMKKSKRFLLAAFAGAILPFAFAPVGWFLFVTLSTILFLLLIEQANSLRHAVKIGLCYGIAFFAVGVSWVYISIHIYGHTHFSIAFLFTLLFIFVLAIFPTLAAAITYLCHQRNILLTRLFIFPIAWTLLEGIRSDLLTGFPWLLLGHSLLNSSLSGWIPVIGIYATGTLCLISSGLLLSIYDQKHKIIYLTVFISVIAAGAGLKQINWSHPSSKPLTISLLQGNIPQNLKWDEHYLEATLGRYWDLTEKASNSKIIIYPEAAIPLAQSEAKLFLNDLHQFARKHQNAMILGIPQDKPTGLYNGVITLGSAQGTYQKRHLVPFGEYVLFEKYLRGLINFFDLPASNFQEGASNQPLLKVQNSWVAPFVCYEIAYGNLVRAGLPKAEWFTVISNDAWFGDSLALGQHLQIAQTQALQTAREIAFVSNTGITALIDSKGKITQRIPTFKTTILTSTITPHQGSTPWTHIGDKIILMIESLIIFLSIGWVIYGERKIRRSK